MRNLLKEALIKMSNSEINYETVDFECINAENDTEYFIGMRTWDGSLHIKTEDFNHRDNISVRNGVLIDGFVVFVGEYFSSGDGTQKMYIVDADNKKLHTKTTITFSDNESIVSDDSIILLLKSQ